jgi:hypothetical protein
MSNLRQNRRKINSKIEVIKKINDNGRNTSSSLSDIYIDNIDVNTKFGNKLNQISNRKILNKINRKAGYFVNKPNGIFNPKISSVKKNKRLSTKKN